MRIDGTKLRHALQERLEDHDPTVNNITFRRGFLDAWDDVVQPVIDAANNERQSNLPNTGPTIPCGSDIAHLGSDELPRHLGDRRSVFGR